MAAPTQALNLHSLGVPSYHVALMASPDGGSDLSLIPQGLTSCSSQTQAQVRPRTRSAQSTLPHGNWPPYYVLPSPTQHDFDLSQTFNVHRMECRPYFLVLIFNDPHVCQLSGEPLPLASATTAVRVQAVRDEDTRQP